MTLVCLWTPSTPTGAASVAELGALLLERAPRVVVAGPRGEGAAARRDETTRRDEAAPSELVWADARGLEPRPLAESLLAILRAHGRPASRAGVARTPIAAEVAAVHGDRALPITEVPPGRDREFLAPFPISVLHPEPDLGALLEGTGIERCGDLAALDRESVEVRFGGAALALWRLARGDDRRHLFGPPPPPLPHASLEWTDYVLRDPERLLFVVNRLVASVCRSLRERGQGASGFTLVFALDRGGAVEQPFRPSRANADPRTWIRLVRDGLERVRLPDAVSGIALRVDAARPSESVQGDLLDRGFATAGVAEAAVAKVLDRNALLLAPRNSRHPLLRRRTEWLEQPASLVWARPQLGPGDAEPCLALYLLPEPERVVVQTADRRGYAVPVRYRGKDGWHELLTASGPDCVSGGRWDEPYAYELYCCVRADGELVQLGRDARRGAWELHGTWR